MPATPFADLNSVLDLFLQRVTDVLGDDLVGVYLHGSFALGDFDEHSDVDFLAVLQRDLTQAETRALNAVHERLHAEPNGWARKLEGSYAPAPLLRKWSTEPRDPPFEPRSADWADLETGGRPPLAYPFWFVNNGAKSLVRSEHDNTRVVRWMVRERGITLFGPPPQTLIEAIPPQALREELWNTTSSIGHGLLADPGQIDAAWIQGFMALLFARMLHAIETGEIHSKRAVVRWSERQFEPKFAELIGDAFQQRYHFEQAFSTPASPAAVSATLELVQHVLRRGRALVGEAKL